MPFHVNNLNGFITSALKLPIVNFLEIRTNSVDASSFTETSVNLGEEHWDRTIVCVVMAVSTATPTSVTSVTINGVACTLHAANISAQAGYFAVLRVPTGTSATVITTFNRTVALYSVSLFSMLNLNSTTPSMRNITGTTTSLTLTNVSTPENTVTIFGCRTGVTTPTTYTNATLLGGKVNGSGYDSVAYINNIGKGGTTVSVTTGTFSTSQASMLISGNFG